MIRAGVFGTNVVLETDDPTVKPLLEYQYEDEVFNFWVKHKQVQKIRGKIYEKTKKDPATGHTYYQLGLGWIAYIINTFAPYLSVQDVDTLKSAVFQETYRAYPFPELWDIQNSDVLHLLKYKFGLFTVYTGYGKTSCITVISKYLSDMGKKVLLVTPSTKARDELIKRIDSMYGIKVSTKKFGGSDRIQSLITSGFMNRIEVKNNDPAFLKELESFDAILCDEVEYCINPSGCYIFDHCTNVEYRYGFSGTADKKNGDMINFQNGLSDPSVARNRDLVTYFGPSLVYRKPLGKKIELIHIATRSMNGIKVADSGGNVYLDTMTTIFTDPGVCDVIDKIIEKYPRLFIPINNLQNIIYHWIETRWKGKFRVLLVKGAGQGKDEGYTYYDLSGTAKDLTLSEACDYIRNDLVDVIPSTSSGFRALDFPNLSNILLFASNIAGSVLQQIGRIARQDEMNIISITPVGKRKIPIYTKGCENRETMIKEYYKYCDITSVYINETDL